MFTIKSGNSLKIYPNSINLHIAMAINKLVLFDPSSPINRHDCQELKNLKQTSFESTQKNYFAPVVHYAL